MSNQLKENLDILNKNFDVLKNDYAVKRVGIFGSYLRGKQTPKSDIDVLVEFNQAPGFFKFIELEERLSKLLNKKVDLVTKKALKPAIKQQVLQKIVYA